MYAETRTSIAFQNVRLLVLTKPDNPIVKLTTRK